MVILDDNRGFASVQLCIPVTVVTCVLWPPAIALNHNAVNCRSTPASPGPLATEVNWGDPKKEVQID